MFSLFTQPMAPPHETYLLRDYKQVLSAVAVLANYYKESSYRVNNNHVLVKLINLLMNDRHDTDSFIRSVRSMMDSTAILGFNTAYKPGKLLDDPFAGGLNKCMIYIEDTTRMVGSPVRVVYHPFTHTNLPLLDGHQLLNSLAKDENTSHISTYSIAVVPLLLGYKRYLQVTPADTTYRGPAHYLYTWVLPGMLLSFYHLALWNRQWYPIAGKPLANVSNQHRIRTLNLSNSSMKAFNTVKELRSVNITSYKDILTWQQRRGYSLSSLGLLPPDIQIYRPTAAFAWFSRAAMIKGLLLLGGHSIRLRQGEWIRDLVYQQTLTVNGRLVTDPLQRTLVGHLINDVSDALNFVD